MTSKEELRKRLATSAGRGDEPGCASMTPPTPIRGEGRTGWVWRVGTPWATDSVAGLRFLKQTPEFDALSDACSRLKRENLGKPPRKRRLEATTWNARLVRFGLQYSVAQRLIQIAGVPELIAGEGPGEWAALALSGALSLDDALRGLMEAGSPPPGSLRRGLTCACVPSLPQSIPPLAEDANLLHRLAERISLLGDSWPILLKKSGHLAEHQPTFRRLLEEWNSPLAAEGVEPLKWLRETAGGPVGVSLLDTRTRALALVLLTALRKLNRKWNLSEQIPPPDPVLGDLAELVVQGVFDPEDAVALLFGRFARTKDLPGRLAARCFFRFSDEPNIEIVKQFHRF